MTAVTTPPRRPTREADTTARLTARFTHQPAWVTVIEIFIGLGWLRAAVSKAIDPRWWSGEYLIGFLDDHAGQTLGWYQPFVDTAVRPAPATTAAVVLLAQLATAAIVLSGRSRVAGLGLGMGLNLHFVAAGAVNPSAFYILAQGAVLLWVAEQSSSARASRVLSAVALIGVTVAGFNLPFAQTLHPHTVIDDPAIMFATMGGLTALGAAVVAGDDPRHS